MQLQEMERHSFKARFKAIFFTFSGNVLHDIYISKLISFFHNFPWAKQIIYMELFYKCNLCCYKHKRFHFFSNSKNLFELGSNLHNSKQTWVIYVENYYQNFVTCSFLQIISSFQIWEIGTRINGYVYHKYSFRTS